ncbi:hypothetical protein K443DRAFT_12283 [Laccaria amethystina LaAM-08-1]|uniref:Uncharacterized protein n=1 Tax=Laccaria amethystina LaAM-08-1 TaxID=1095629 RepID=A0A0C9WRU9_9AGAR|nr:hypothetical protein K443DRAFT_12283 [Laccaria amethystina LaAM-08-1]
MKTWVKISINFTLAAMHLAYLINSNFHESMPDLPTLTPGTFEQLKDVQNFSSAEINILANLVDLKDMLPESKPTP